jgi:Raf kinase inhibitor-like YbhB/YbcL family protein
VPEQAASLCLTLEDPDAPGGAWLHWLLYDIPASSSGLPAGLPSSERLDDGSLQGLYWGVSRYQRQGYQGPEPPPGPAHHYVFTLSALSCRLGLPPGSSLAQVRAAMAGRELATARMGGDYAASTAVRHCVTTSRLLVDRGAAASSSRASRWRSRRPGP